MLTPTHEARLRAALARWGQHQVQRETTVVDVYIIAGALQLALRHPAFPAHSRAVLTRHLERWGAGLGQADPALAELLRLGNNPAYDVPTQEA